MDTIQNIQPDSKRLCRKCQEIIPNRIKIDNKTHNLRNRKFCLVCSPFKQHNTSANDPIERVRKGPYKKWSEKAKSSVKRCLYKRAYTRKLELVKRKGGCCQSCGYSKSLRVLTFHHRNRDEKLFGLSLNHLWSKDWELIQNEADKCDLLCMNCHAELEESISNANLCDELRTVKTSFNLL